VFGTMESNYTKIYQTSNPIQAEILMQMLQENNIKTVCMNKMDSSYHAFGLIEIYCHSNDVVTALHLITQSNQ
jgi:hypothetical protein